MGGEIGLKDQDTATKGHAHPDACQYSLNQEQLPKGMAPAGDQDRHEHQKATAVETQTEVAFVDQGTDHDTHGEQKEDLATANPCNGCGRFIREKNRFVIGLKDSVRLDAN